ncbi:hypothetical protein [Methyloceanibacter superfactus]|jgi:hypothetical protein|uniref:hypothetical protein n=1 Tax=Methyloceanibacter superfactus TaxID=1774969 RepID=UPI000B1878FE|nr:hypothetical protein [Methyloceanibacter superfactus]
MGWLRKERDLIGLVVVWTILLQAIIVPFTSGLHAATLTSGPQSNILCTSRGTVVSPEQPGPANKKPDCQCCHMSCRQGCGSGCGGILPDLARIPLPSSTVIAIAGPRLDAPSARPGKHHSAQPRAPPLA